MLPTVMFSVQTRITLYQSEFLLTKAEVTAEQIQGFLDQIQSDVIEGICGTSTSTPRATLKQMEIDLIDRIQNLPTEWAKVVAADGDNMPPKCVDSGGSFWDNHANVQGKVSTFQTEQTGSLLQGIALYRSAAMQYVTLFGIVQQIFLAHGNVSVSAVPGVGLPATPLITHFGDIRNRITTACSLDSILQFVHATSKLADDETGEATMFGSLKQLDDMLQQFVQNSDQPAFVYDSCSTPPDAGDDPSCDALGKTCGRMASMQQSFLGNVTQAMACTNATINMQQADETVYFIGPGVDHPIEGGEWYYENDPVGSAQMGNCPLDCDNPSDPSHPPIVQDGLISNALWWSWEPQPLGYSCFPQFSVDAYVPPAPNPPPPPSPPPLPPETYSPRLYISLQAASSSPAPGSGADAACVGDFNNKAGIGGTIVVIKDYNALESTELLRYAPTKDEVSPALRMVGIFQGDVSTPSYGTGFLTPFARVLDINALGNSNEWVIVPVADNVSDPGYLMGGGPVMPPLASASGEPDDPMLARYNQRVRLQSAYNSSEYLTLNLGCTALSSQAAKLVLKQAADQPPHPPPPNPPPPPPSPSPAPMQPGGVSLGRSSIAQHQVMLWDWANNSKWGLLDIGSFHGDVHATPTAFNVYSLSGATVPAQPNHICSTQDFYRPSLEGHLLFNSSAEACEAWANDASSSGALAYGQSLESACISNAVGTTNCSHTCCVKLQSPIDAITDVLGLFSPTASKDASGQTSYKRFDAGQCTKEVNPLVFLPTEATCQWLPDVSKTKSSASTENKTGPYIYNTSNLAEAACLASGCAGLADPESLIRRPNLCKMGYVDENICETKSIWNCPDAFNLNRGWYMNTSISGCGDGIGYHYFNVVGPENQYGGSVAGAYCQNCPLCGDENNGQAPVAPTQVHPWATSSYTSWSSELQIVRMALMPGTGNGAEVYQVSTDQEGGLIDGDLVGFYAKSPGGSWVPFVLPESSNCLVDAPGGYAPTSWFKLAPISP